MKKINLVYLTLIALTLSACSGGGGGGGSPAPGPNPNPTATCSDIYADNQGSALPCNCVSPRVASSDGATCEDPTVPTNYTYYPTYSPYSPTQLNTVVCSGVVVTNRTFSCVRNDSAPVANSFCPVDPSPTSTVLSKAGSIATTPTNPALTNGTEYMACAAGATTGTRSILCNANFTLTGGTLATQTCEPAAYNATFGSYTPIQANTTPCQGDVVTNRSISSCRRASDNATVLNSFCSDPTPTSTVQSRAGTIIVTASNPSLTNGNQKMSCAIGATSGTQVVMCTGAYHVEGLTLATQNCYANSKSCSPMPTGVTTGTQSWNGSAYDSCVATVCSAGYTLSGGLCLDNSASSNSLTFRDKFALLIQPNGTLKGWGFNGQGQLGQGDTTNKLSSATINVGAGLTTKKVVTNGSSTCAILSDSSLKCWGSNTSGQLGVGDATARLFPASVDLGGKTAKDLIAGGFSFCAILNDDSLSCWGLNAYGQLGVGLNGGVPVNKTSPTAVDVGAGLTVKKVVMTKVSGNDTTCAILSDSSLKCWGYNGQGQVGNGNTTDRSLPTAVTFSGGQTVKDVVFYSDSDQPNNHSTCAILSDNSLSCWGHNANGRLGVGDTVNKSSPTAISLGASRTVKKLYGNKFGSICVIMDDSNVKCWGKNSANQVGDGTLIDRTLPVSVTFPSAKTVKELVIGNAGSNCAIHTDSSMSCWGGNLTGQLGIGNSYSASSPTSVDLGTNTVKKIATSDYLACIITTNGGVMCSGSNHKGSLGTGSAYLTESTFASVDLGVGKTAVELSSEIYGTCALLNDDTVKCWGYNESGKLGTGDADGAFITTPKIVN